MRPAPAHPCPDNFPRRTRPGSRLRSACTACLVTGLAIMMMTPGAAAAVDLGDASILSRQGQRLQLAIPFGSDPGERVSATRFSVVSVEAPGDGAAPPDPRGFTISRPEQRNVVYLRSDRPVDNERLRIVVSVSDPGGEAARIAYDIVIPPARHAPARDPHTPRPPRR